MIVTLVEVLFRALLVVASLVAQIIIGLIIATVRFLMPLIVRGLNWVWVQVKELMNREHLGPGIGDGGECESHRPEPRG